MADTKHPMPRVETAVKEGTEGRDAGFGGLTESVVEDGGAVAVGGGGVVGEGSVDAAAVVVVSCAGGDGGAGVKDDAVTTYELAGSFHAGDRCCGNDLRVLLVGATFPDVTIT